MMDWLHQVFVGHVGTRWQLWVAGFIVMEWWLMDHVWFLGTVVGWW